MSITLNAVAYTFAGFLAPNSISQYIAYGSGTGTPAGMSVLTNKIDRGAQTKVRWKLHLPTVATSDSSCTCTGEILRDHIADIVFTVPPGSLGTERSDLLARIQDLVLTAEFAASVTGLVQASS